MPTAGGLQSRELNTEDAAALLGVHPHTLRAWAKRGHFPARRIGPRGWLRFDLADIERYNEHGAAGVDAS